MPPRTCFPIRSYKDSRSVTVHVGTAAPTTAHVGTAALGCPAEQRSAALHKLIPCHPDPGSPRPNRKRGPSGPRYFCNLLHLHTQLRHCKVYESRHRTTGNTTSSCRITPARVERTLLSAAFDLDFDFDFTFPARTRPDPTWKSGASAPRKASNKKAASAADVRRL